MDNKISIEDYEWVSDKEAIVTCSSVNKNGDIIFLQGIIEVVEQKEYDVCPTCGGVRRHKQCLKVRCQL